MQHKCTLKCTFYSNLRCTFLFTFIQILKCNFRCNSVCIIKCILNCTIKRTSNIFIVVPFALSWASPGALKNSLLLSFFNCPDFASIFPLGPFLRAFSSVFQITSHLNLEKLFLTFLCSPKQKCTLKCTMIYTNYLSFIVLVSHYMLALSKD